MNTYRQRQLASDRSTAYDVTNQAFNALLAYFGPQAIMPMVYWGQGSYNKGQTLGSHGAAGEAYLAADKVSGFPHGAVRIDLNNLYNLALGQHLLGNHKKAFRGQAEGMKQGALDVLIHELAHTQQLEPELRRPISRMKNDRNLQIEGGAEAFTRLARGRVAAKLGMRPPNPLVSPGNYGTMANRFLNKYGANYALWRQFGQRGTLHQR